MRGVSHEEGIIHLRHNSGRSQMAEAFFNRMAEGKATGISAGVEPGSGVNPVVAQAVREIGIDIGQKMSKLLTQEMIDNSDLVIKMGRMDPVEVCPTDFVPDEDWGINDPHWKLIEEVRPVREEIKRRVEALLKRLDIEGATAYS